MRQVRGRVREVGDGVGGEVENGGGGQGTSRERGVSAVRAACPVSLHNTRQSGDYFR